MGNLQFYMKKDSKTIIIFYVFFAIAVTLGILYIDSTFGDLSFNILPTAATYLETERNVPLESKIIFDVMADVKNYSHILPQNIKNVTIIEINKNETFAEIEIFEAGIGTVLTIKHVSFPYDKQIIEVLDGDAKGTKITQTFEELIDLDKPIGQNISTKLNTKVNVEFHGVLAPFSFVAKSNLYSALDTARSSFVIYAKNSQNETHKIVDDLYREILLRPVDEPALEYYSSLLEQKEITFDDLRIILLESAEREGINFSLSQISEKNKNIVHKLYNEILERDADYNGLIHYGGLLELKEINEDELRDILFSSKEALGIRFQQPGVPVIDAIFVDIFDRHATEEELDYYVPMLLELENTRLESGLYAADVGLEAIREQIRNQN